MAQRHQHHGGKVAAAVHEALGEGTPDCRRCQKPEAAALRRAWGCDAPAPRAVFRITCMECGGGGGEACRRCGGAGEVDLHRCAKATAGGDPFIPSFMRAWGAWRQHGVLPGKGGWEDQTRGWVRLCSMADVEAGRIMDQRERSRQEQEKRAAKRAELERRVR